MILYNVQRRRLIGVAEAIRLTAVFCLAYCGRHPKAPSIVEWILNVNIKLYKFVAKVCTSTLHYTTGKYIWRGVVNPLEWTGK